VKVWSWAMVMYEIMSLKRPFEDVNMFHIKDVTLKGAISLSEELENKYKPLMPLWRMCLQLEPSERPNVNAVKEQLIKLM
jgi:hypothetical protein